MGLQALNGQLRRSLRAGARSPRNIVGLHKTFSSRFLCFFFLRKLIIGQLICLVAGSAVHAQLIA
jgi:hypothetical protein